MPCKRQRQLPTKCTPTSRRMLEGLTIKDLSEATPDYLPSSHTPHPIPNSGQYANDLDDCNPGVSCTTCTTHHQGSSGTLSLSSDPQTPSQSETCVPTFREVSAMYDDIRQCRYTIGELAKEAQQLITKASGILDGCGCDKSFQAKQQNKVGHNELKRTSNKISYGQKICRETSNEKLIPCASCENAAKKRRSTVQNGNAVMSKKYNTAMYEKRSSYKAVNQKQQIYQVKSKVHVIPSNPKIRQRNEANLKNEKQAAIKNCCQKICGDDCLCDADETETKRQNKLNGGNTTESKGDVDNCGCKKKTTCKEKLSKTICGKTNSCVCVTPNDASEDMKQDNKSANIKNGSHKKNGKVAINKNTCRNCARRDFENSPTKEVLKKQNKAFKIPNRKNGLQKKNGKTTNDIKKSVCPDNEKFCKIDCEGKVKEKEEMNKPNTAPSNIDVDDCSCVREMKKRTKKLSRFARIWRIIREEDISCDCAKKADRCGCDEDMDSQTSCLKQTSSKICCLKKNSNKLCGKNVTCNCSSKKVVDCRCDDVMEDQSGIFKRVRSSFSLDKIRNKVCGKNTTCECPSKNVDDCECDDDMENQNSLFKKAVRDNCSLTKIRNKDCGKNISCECTSKADDCGCDEDMENQKGFFKNVLIDTCSLTKIKKKVCGKVTCECPQEKIEKTTSHKDTGSVSVAPRVVTNFVFNKAKNKQGKKVKSDSKVGSSHISSSAEKSCKCCFPPAFSQYFKCTGQIGGNCQCDKSE